MKISRVKIENYRNLKNVDVALENIVSVVGANNSGKSNFLRALMIPLSAETSAASKQLTWYDINREAKKTYYTFLETNKKSIIDNSLDLDTFIQHIPVVRIVLYLEPNDKEHYNVKDILCEDDDENWVGGIAYTFFVKQPNELLDRVREVLSLEPVDDKVQMSLLPIELYTYSITVPKKGSKVAYDVLSKFRTVELPADRDSFASNSSKLGSKALAELLQKALNGESQAKIEKKYNDFFETIRREGDLDTILNWQVYSEIPNAQDFFKEITILPNMPQMSSILGSIRLGYENDNMFSQGLGHRNLVLMAVILNSYIEKSGDVSFRLVTVEEPEAHLCNSNILLMTSLFNSFIQKNDYTQIVYSTHSTEFVNKVGLDKVLVFYNGDVINLSEELSETECDYLTANPNTDIFELFYSRKIILVEGLTDELLIKSYLQTKDELHDIKVLSFHKGFQKIIRIWKKINGGNGKKLGIVRDSDDQPKAQAEHEQLQDSQITVRTTKGYTLETDVTNSNYELLKEKYGTDYGWSDMTSDELQADWREKKSDIMLRICHDLVNGDLQDFRLPQHMQQIIDFMQGDSNDC